MAEAVLKTVQSILQPLVSIPEGPAALVMRRAEERITAALMLSNTTECTSDGASSPSNGWMASAVAGSLIRCLLFSSSRTVVDPCCWKG